MQDLFQSRSSTAVHILRDVSGRVKSEWSPISSKADLGGASGSNAVVAKCGGSNGGGSKAAVVKGGGKAAAGGTSGGSFAAVGKGVGKAPACVQVVELVKSDALNVLRSWIKSHRRIYKVIGSKVRTVDKPLL